VNDVGVNNSLILKLKYFILIEYLINLWISWFLVPSTNILLIILTTEPVMPGWPGDPIDPFSPIAPSILNTNKISKCKTWKNTYIICVYSFFLL